MRFRVPFLMAGVLLIAGVVLGVQLNATIIRGDAFEALRKLEAAFLTISERYVDQVDTAKLSEDAIKGMLGNLDPHSIYLSSEQMRSVNEDFNASFEGVGISFEMIEGAEAGQDTITVINVISDGPSDRAGLLSGDRIVEVDGESAIGFSTADVQRTLRGPRGTNVNVVVTRPGRPDAISYDITRDRIPLYTLDAAYMVDDVTGYIRLNRFARSTYDEFVDAMGDLMAEGMQRLILDLRDNAGGFMDMAVRISDEFLGNGAEIVTARSRHPEFNQANIARANGRFESQPVIVLLNERSASASEIVAGALQDHDRALIVGRRSFGKGLVQKQFGMNDGSALRMTISRFYTPSGRLIQTPYEDGLRDDYYQEKYEQLRNERAQSAESLIDEVPDSLKYSTAGGRVVFGGGGILPDYLVYPDTLSPIMRVIRGRSIDQEFARGWLDRHGDEVRDAFPDARAFIADFAVDDEMMAEFTSYATSHGLDVGPVGEASFSHAELQAERRTLSVLLKAHVGNRLYGRAAWYPVFHDIDRTFQEAMTLWPSAETLATM